LQGELRIDIGGDERALGVGDSTTFSARTPHNWWNPLNTDSQVLWVISPPLPLNSQGDTTAERTSADSL
jgi:mannose-6-phosphate isomerase-like protein (cupin superfamily)